MKAAAKQCQPFPRFGRPNRAGSEAPSRSKLRTWYNTSLSGRDYPLLALHWHGLVCQLLLIPSVIPPKASFKED